MVVGTLNKETKKLHVNYNGEEVVCNLVKIPASKDKSEASDGYWAHVEKLGAGRKWFTIPSLSLAEDTIEFDETYARAVSRRKSRMISLTNIKEFLNEEDGAAVDALVEKATAERDRQDEEAAANAPVKEKKRRAMTPEEKLAKMEADAEKLRKQIAGELPMEEPKPKKAKVKKEDIVDLDDAAPETENA